MSTAVSLADMRTEVRELLGWENDDFVTDNELDRRLIRACRRLYGLLVASRGHEYYREIYDFNTVAGTYEYELPTQFWQLLAVLRNTSDVLPGGRGVTPVSSAEGGWSRVDAWEPQEIQRLMNGETFSGWPSDRMRYRLGGHQWVEDDTGTTSTDVIELRPTPQAVFTVRVLYVPRLYTYESGEATIGNWINGWHDWAVYKIAAECAKKEESLEQAASFDAELPKIEAEIKTHAGSRDLYRGKRVIDVRRTRGDRWPRLGPARGSARSLKRRAVSARNSSSETYVKRWPTRQRTGEWSSLGAAPRPSARPS